MADLNILILGKLDATKTAQQMNQQLDELQSKLKTLNIDLKIDQNVVNQMKNMNNSVQQTSQLIQQQTQDYVRQGAVIQATSEKIKIAKDGTQQWVGSQAKLLDAQGKQINLLENTKGLVETTTENFAEQALMAQKLVGTFNELKKDVISTGDIKGVIQQLNPGMSIEKLKPLDDWGRKWQATLSDGAKVSQAFKYQINSMTGELFAFDKGLENATNKNMGFVEQLKIAAARIPVWFVAMTGYVQLTRAIVGGYKYMVDFDKQMNQIAIVTGKTQKEISALGFEYQQLAMDMGVTTKEIANASVEFLRQGLSAEESMKRVSIATKYAKVANLDFTQSAELLTAATQSMEVPIERVADVFDLLGDLTSTSPAELGIAFQKVGGTVKSANIEFEKMASWISTISAKTREAPSSIGDAMKSMLARFMNITQGGFDEEDGQNINDVSAALKTVGIDLINQVSGNFNDFGTIIDKLGTKWDTLDSRTRAYLGTALAGRFCPAM